MYFVITLMFGASISKINISEAESEFILAEKKSLLRRKRGVIASVIMFILVVIMLGVSFKTNKDNIALKENAEKKIAELKDMGYSPSRIGVNKYGLHQVVYMSTDNAQEAVIYQACISVEEF